MSVETDAEEGFKTDVDGVAFGEYLDAVSAICHEAVIEPHDGGTQTEAVDPASVAMVRATLFAEAFNGGVEATRFGFDPDRLGELLTDDPVTTLDYDADTRKLDMVTGRYRYTHAAHDPDTVRGTDGPPEMDLNFEGVIPAADLKHAAEWFDGFTTYIRMGYDPGENEFWMEAIERNGDSMGTDDGCFSIPLLNPAERGHADSHFSTDYFRDIVDAIPEGRMVTLQLGEEFPMMLSYPIHDGAGEPCGRVEFMQAPRIQSD